MTLQELIDQLAAATDGAAEEPKYRIVWEIFPHVTRTRVTYIKRDAYTIEASQILVLVENIDTPEEAAFFEQGKIPQPILQTLHVPIEPLFTAKEIKDAVNKGGFKIVNRRNEDDHMVVDGYIDDPTTPTEKVLETRWYVFKQGATIFAKRIN